MRKIPSPERKLKGTELRLAQLTRGHRELAMTSGSHRMPAESHRASPSASPLARASVLASE